MKLQKIIALALAKGFSEVEVSYSRNSSVSFELFERKLEKNEISISSGLTIRGVYQGHISTVSTENISEKEFDVLLDRLKDSCLAITSNEPFLIFEGSPKYTKVSTKSFDFTSVSQSEKLDRAYKLNDLIVSKDKRIEKVEISYSEAKSESEMYNSKGLNLKKKKVYAYYVASAVIKDGEDSRDNYEYEVKSKDNDFNIANIAEELTYGLISQLHPQQIPSGEYAVLLDNRVVNDIVGAFFSMFSGYSAIRNLTLLKDKIGEKVFGDNITLIDDPFDSNSFSQESFDDEGVACQKRTLVEKGVLKTLFHNLKTSIMLKTEPTGHGFGGGVSFTNLLLTPGTTPLKELIASLKDGVYVTSLAGLHAGLNPVSGDFSGQVSGYKIENGSIAYPVSLLVLADNFITLLNKVEVLGNDVRRSLSGVASPSLLIKACKIAGK